MNLLCVIATLAATGMGLATLTLWATIDSTLHRVRGFQPSVRVWWLLGMMSFPSAVALLLALVGFGPCLRTLLIGFPDDCQSHGGPDFFFCLRRSMQAVPAAWLIAGAFATFVARRLVEGMRALLQTRRVLHQLRRLGRYDQDCNVWCVPGKLAVVAGWPRSDVYVGVSLRRSLSPESFGALLAHERAHQRRMDLSIKLAAQVLSSCLPSTIRRVLLNELDLAMEQACDAVAAEEVKDPLAVVRSLLDAAGGTEPGILAVAFSATDDHLEARVRALCEPSWAPSLLSAAAVAAIGASVVVGCIIFDANLHDVTEAFFERLLG